MAAKVWSGVAVAIQSALASALTISGITKASPGVLTYSSGTDPSDGDFVVLTDVLGMYQLDDSIARVDNPNSGSNTFELEGWDTTLFDTFTSGNAQVITFGTTLSKAVNVTASGGDFEFIDTTTIHGNTRSRIPGVASPVSLSFSCQWDPADTALAALKAASRAKAKRAVRITFSDGAKFLLYGYVGATLIPTGNAQELVTTNVVFEGINAGTAYSS